MTIQVFGADATVSYLNRAFTDTSPANAIFKNQVARVEKIGDAFFANEFAASWSSVSNAALSKQVLTNFGVLPSTNPDIALLETMLTEIFATNSTNRGIVVLNLANILANLESTATGAQAVYKDMAAAWNAEVTAAYTYSANTSNTTSSASGTSGTNKSLTLTTGTDTLAGGAGDDTFNAILGTGATLNGFDSMDGGAGTDTLVISNSGSTITDGAISGLGLTRTSIETLVINSVTQTVSVTSADIGGATKVALNNTSAANTVTSLPDAVTELTLKGAATHVIPTAAITSTSKLATVNLENINAAPISSGSTAAILPATVTTLTATNTTAVAGVTALATSLTLNAAGTSDSAFALTATAAKDITINTTNTGTTGATVTATTWNAAKTLTSKGAGNLVIDVSGATGLTTVDAAAATGKQTITIAATALAVTTGTGNDTVTQAAALGATQKIATGAGDDTVTLTAGWTAGATVDGGAGTDTLNVGATFSSLTGITGFEILGASANTITLDATGFTGITSSGSAVPTFNNVAAGVGFTTTSTGGATIQLKDSSGSADALSITLNKTTSTATLSAGTVVATGVENLTVVSNGTFTTGANTITLNDATAKTVTLSGPAALTLSAATLGTSGATTGLSLIDGSAATGVLTLDVSSTTNYVPAAAGLTVKGGTANDVITLNVATAVPNVNKSLYKVDLSAGGNDSVVVTGAPAAAGYYPSITGASAGDTITITGLAVTPTASVTSATLGAKITLGSAASFANYLDAAASGATIATATTIAPVKWFQFTDGNTYLVVDNSTNTTFADGVDSVIQLVGLVDLSTAVNATTTTTRTITLA